MISELLQYWYPDWEPPDDYGTWNSCLCPFHGEDNPSASVSFEHEAFKCHSCGMKGNVVNLIKRKEGVAYGEAVERAKTILGGSYDPVQAQPTRKSGRGVPRRSGSSRGQRPGKSGFIPFRVRR